ncbi:MAG: hypothetical protein ACKVII_25795, partial [Planctomycetales bacterium]
MASFRIEEHYGMTFSPGRRPAGLMDELVGCDQRAKLESRCAGAEILRVLVTLWYHERRPRGHTSR